MAHDITMPDVDAFPDIVEDASNFIVAVDFGTTFSCVCYARYTHDTQRRRTGLEQIEVVAQYPNQPYQNLAPQDVPTEIWYEKDAARIAHQPEHNNSNLDELDNSDSDEDDGGGLLRPFLTEAALAMLPKTSAPANPDSIMWGYGVQERLKNAEYNDSNGRHLSRFKLMLSEKDEAAPVRRRVFETCQMLKKLNLIREDIDVICDYLDQLFRNTKAVLTEVGGYNEDSTIEFVLCIPAIWNPRACREMQKAMATAIRNSGLGKLHNGAVDNLFLVSEPEAAAACVLSEDASQVKISDIFVLLDAGGGTVDAITYTVSRDVPLRLQSEIVPEGGALCGSSYINERLETLLVEKLKDEHYLDTAAQTRPQIINRLVIDFERNEKQRWDRQLLTRQGEFHIRIPGLRSGKKKRYHENILILKRTEVQDLFMPSLEGVADLMKEQLQEARSKGHSVKKVVLVGGFGQSHCLKAYLRGVLTQENNNGAEAVDLVVVKPRSAASAVARGAILQASRKEHGHERILKCSYGFSRQEMYGSHNEHIGQECRHDKTDGITYVDHTIDWILNAGDIVKSEHVIERIVEQTFPLGNKRLVCHEYLWVSDNKQKHPLHYRHDHPNNYGAEPADKMVVDMTFRRKEGLKTVKPPGSSINFWKVNFTLLIIVSGRNLRYEARFPDRNGRLIKAGAVSIASAFSPGTD